MNEDNFKRTFIHEVGHFVSYILNENHFIGGKVESITIHEKIISNSIDYMGITTPVKPINQKKIKGVINLPEKLACLVYGCIFQSLQQKTKFGDCFNNLDSSVNGHHDAQSFVGGLAQYTIPRSIREKLLEFINSYYDDLNWFGPL